MSPEVSALYGSFPLPMKLLNSPQKKAPLNCTGIRSTHCSRAYVVYRVVVFCAGSVYSSLNSFLGHIHNRSELRSCPCCSLRLINSVAIAHYYNCNRILFESLIFRLCQWIAKERTPKMYIRVFGRGCFSRF